MTAATRILPEISSAPHTALRELASYVNAERDPEALSVVRARLHGVVRALDEALGEARPRGAASRAHVLLELHADDVRCVARGVTLDLSRRRLARAFLMVLGRARLEAPNRPVEWSRVAAEVWPGEQMLEMAARNRVKVGIAWLRKAGLREAIASDARGYWLTDACSVAATTAP